MSGYLLLCRHSYVVFLTSSGLQSGFVFRSAVYNKYSELTTSKIMKRRCVSSIFGLPIAVSTFIQSFDRAKFCGLYVTFARWIVINQNCSEKKTKNLNMDTLLTTTTTTKIECTFPRVQFRYSFGPFGLIFIRQFIDIGAQLNFNIC